MPCKREKAAPRLELRHKVARETMIGFAIHALTGRVSAELANRYRGLRTAKYQRLHVAHGGRGSLTAPDAGGPATPASTVKTRPGDNLLVHKALDLTLPRGRR